MFIGKSCKLENFSGLILMHLLCCHLSHQIHSRNSAVMGSLHLTHSSSSKDASIFSEVAGKVELSSELCLIPLTFGISTSISFHFIEFKQYFLMDERSKVCADSYGYNLHNSCTLLSSFMCLVCIVDIESVPIMLLKYCQENFQDIRSSVNNADIFTIIILCW